jgi:hypothetical protein
MRCAALRCAALRCAALRVVGYPHGVVTTARREQSDGHTQLSLSLVALFSGLFELHHMAVHIDGVDGGLMQVLMERVTVVLDHLAREMRHCAVVGNQLYAQLTLQIHVPNVAQIQSAATATGACAAAVASAFAGRPTGAAAVPSILVIAAGATGSIGAAASAAGACARAVGPTSSGAACACAARTPCAGAGVFGVAFAPHIPVVPFALKIAICKRLGERGQGLVHSSDESTKSG